jgi:AcrR family transcriptional regulator
MTSEGLRERKKQRTREALVGAALELFEQRGFERTTIADIAEAAEIAPRTFFAYFPSKEDVVFWDFEEQLADFAAKLRERPAEQTTFEAIREWFAATVARPEAQTERHQRRRRVVAANDALADHERHLVGRFQALIAEAVARDLGEEPGGPRSRLVAAAAAAAFESLQDQYKREDQLELPHDPKQKLEIIDEALSFVEGGIAALRDRPAP